MNKRIGIIGGAFNPIHKGHIYISLNALKIANLDEIWFMPEYNPTHKEMSSLIDYDDRCNIIEFEIKNILNFKISKIEKELYDNHILNKTSTYEVLNEIKKIYNDIDIYFIVGFDSMINIKAWYYYEDLLKNYKFIVFNRDLPINEKIDIIDEEYLKHLQKIYGLQYQYIKIPTIDISATKLRENINNENFLSKYLTKESIDYIKNKCLY